MPPPTSSQAVAFALLQDEVARLRRERTCDLEQFRKEQEADRAAIKEIQKCIAQIKLTHLKWGMVARMAGWGIGALVAAWQLVWPIVREFWK